MITDVFLDQKGVNVCEHTVKMAPCEIFLKVPAGGVVRQEWRGWREN